MQQEQSTEKWKWGKGEDLRKYQDMSLEAWRRARLGFKLSACAC
jgi:hypothetical protein